MTLTKNSERKLGVILQYLQMGLSTIITFIYTPIMLRYLGQTEHGIYSLAGSFISYLSLLTLGFGGSYLKFYSKYKANNDEDNIKKLNGLFLIAFCIMGVVCLIAGVLLTSDFFMRLVFDQGLTDDQYVLARKLMIILVINMALSFPASVFTSYITSQEKFVFQKLVNMIRTVLSPALNIPLLLMGYRSVALVLVTLGLAIFTDFLNIFYCFTKLHMGFIFHGFEKGLFKEIFWFSFFIAINNIIDQINWQTDKMIITRYRGADEVSVYSVGANINTLYISFSTAISSVFAPLVNQIVSEKKEGWNEELNRLFRKVGRIQFYLMALILTGFIFFGQYFIFRWAGDGTHAYDDAYYVALLLMAPVTVPLCQNLGIEIQRAENKHQFRSIVYLSVAVANVIMSIFLTQKWGAIGAAIGTCISLVLGNIIVMDIFYHFVLHIDMVKYWLGVLRILPGLIIPVGCGVCMMLFYQFHSLWDFFGLIVAYTAIYCVSMYFLGIRKEERQYINTKVKGIFHKHSKENATNRDNHQ